MIYNINKFSNIKFKFFNDNKKINIRFLKLNKFTFKKVNLLTINHEFVILNNNQFSLNHFIKNLYNKNERYFVLSKSEIYFYNKNLNIKLFSNIFPFIKYNNDFDNLSLNEKHSILFSYYDIIKDLYNPKYNSIQHQYKSFLSFKQNKKIHFKSLLDNNFFFSIKSGFSDVFKLLENRPNRSIFQLDVNSMYPFAMIQNNFSIPRNLKYYENNDLNDILSNKITNGIFNCQLSIKKNLSDKDLNFISYLPINLIDNNTTIPLKITLDDKVNILLHANEIKFYSKYFDIILEDGIYSKKSMDHPLKNLVLETYQKRLNSTGPLKDFYKFILTVSHSVIMERKTITKYNYEKEIYNEFFNDYQFILNDLNLNNSYFYFNSIDENNIVKYNKYNINNEYNVYSLYSQVLANARIHLLELYEKIYNTNINFELCYCNIDSLHISIPNMLKENFLNIFKEICSQTELGKLKIESIGNRGIWFEPGRYWLFKDNELISYKNTIFNDDNSDYNTEYKVLEYIDKNKNYINKNFYLYNTLQYKKQICKINNNHYKFDKFRTFYDKLYNKQKNKSLFKYIFKKYIK